MTVKINYRGQEYSAKYIITNKVGKYDGPQMGHLMLKNSEQILVFEDMVTIGKELYSRPGSTLFIAIEGWGDEEGNTVSAANWFLDNNSVKEAVERRLADRSFDPYEFLPKTTIQVIKSSVR